MVRRMAENGSHHEPPYTEAEVARGGRTIVPQPRRPPKNDPKNNPKNDLPESQTPTPAK